MEVRLCGSELKYEVVECGLELWTEVPNFVSTKANIFFLEKNYWCLVMWFGVEIAASVVDCGLDLWTEVTHLVSPKANIFSFIHWVDLLRFGYVVRSSNRRISGGMRLWLVDGSSQYHFPPRLILSACFIFLMQKIIELLNSNGSSSNFDGWIKNS